MRKSFCHFKEKKRIITACYDYDINTGTLRYGATLFKGDDNNDKWDRKKNNRYAIDRFNENPVVVVFGPSEEGHVKEMGYYNYRRLENVIRKHLVPTLGVKGDPSKVLSNEDKVLYKNFILNKKLSPEEEKYNFEHQLQLDMNTRDYNNDYPSNNNTGENDHHRFFLETLPKLLFASIIVYWYFMLLMNE